MDLKKVFGTAMKAEIEGRELYKSVADRTDDSKAREVFLYLSQEEDMHFESLKKMYDSVVEGEPISIPAVSPLLKFEDAESPIFSREFKERIKDKHYEMSSLSMALRLERDSTEYYRKMAEEVEDKELKSFFTRLADWENDHYEAIYREIAYLEDEYYEKNNFAPF
jgi:rubrerythrin